MGATESTNLVRRLFHRPDPADFYLAFVLKMCRWGGILFIMGVISLIVIDRWVSYQTQDQLYTQADEVTNFDVAVVLGTSKYLGKILNDYYINRISAAINLYQNHKVDSFLLSGDNAHRSYNEPWTMKRDLLRADVPENHIYLDYAGFRTLDSIIRAKEIFDTDNFLIITQKFHCERALFIANFHNIDAKCFAVPGPSSHSGYQIRFREVFARAKAFLDLYIMRARPKFLGPKEPILTHTSAEPDNNPLADEQ